jgi:ferritin-like metal-binding protein YciE
MSVGTLEELLIDELKDLYSAEKRIIRVLPKLLRQFPLRNFSKAWPTTLKRREGRLSGLKTSEKSLGKDGRQDLCCMKGVLEEGSDVLEDTENGAVATLH